MKNYAVYSFIDGKVKRSLGRFRSAADARSYMDYMVFKTGMHQLDPDTEYIAEA